MRNIRFSAILRPVAYELQGTQLKPVEITSQFKSKLHTHIPNARNLSSGKITWHFGNGPGQQKILDYGDRPFFITEEDNQEIVRRIQAGPMTKLRDSFLQGAIAFNSLKDFVNGLAGNHRDAQTIIRNQGTLESSVFKPLLDGLIELTGKFNDAEGQYHAQLQDINTRVWEFNKNVIEEHQAKLSELATEEQRQIEDAYVQEKAGEIQDIYILNGQLVEKAFIDKLQSAVSPPDETKS